MKVIIERRFVVAWRDEFTAETVVWAHDDEQVREIVSRWPKPPPTIVAIEHTKRPALDEEGQMYFDEQGEYERGTLHDTRITIQYDQAEVLGAHSIVEELFTDFQLFDLQLWAESFYK